jgi:hypothetical protein
MPRSSPASTWACWRSASGPLASHTLSFLYVATILTVIGAGIAGSALTYALTWLRESRRTKDANRAPQRAAIAEIVEATYELTLHVFALRDAYEERARQSEGKRFRRVSDAELEELTNQAKRALFGVGRAFHIGRMTVVDADCYEAMAAAFNNFTKLQGTLEGVGEMAPTSPNMRETMASIVLFTGGLNRGTVMLVKAGQKRLSPVQTWWNKWRREEVRQRLEAKYFLPR